MYQSTYRTVRRRLVIMISHLCLPLSFAEMFQKQT